MLLSFPTVVAKTWPSYKSSENLLINTWRNHWTLAAVYFFLVASESMLFLVKFVFSSSAKLLFSLLFHVQWPGLLCCPTLGLNRKKLSAGVSVVMNTVAVCTNVEEDYYWEEKVGLRVKLSVNSCADHQGVRSSYFNFCMFLKGFGLTLWGR